MWPSYKRTVMQHFGMLVVDPLGMSEVTLLKETRETHESMVLIRTFKRLPEERQREELSVEGERAG